MSKILVTGIPSWLGYNLINAMNEGIPEVGIDRTKSKVYFFVQRGINFTINQSDYNFEAYKLSGDITSIIDVYNAIKAVEPDYIVHIAGLIHPKKIVDLYRVNTMGTSNIVESMKLLGLNKKRLVYISSNSSFGTRDYIMNEESEQIPYFNYGMSKYLAEQTILENDINAIILNPCWFYGEGQPLRQTKLFEMIKKGKPLIIGDGNNLRSMTYTGNLAQAILLSLDYNKDPNYIRFWIADKRPYTVNEIYHTIANLLGVDIKPRYVPSLVASACRIADNLLQKVGMYSQYIHIAGEFDRNIACSSYRAMKELGYNPIVELEEGMRRSIEWINKRYKLCVS